jgi:hypothetical protein
MAVVGEYVAPAAPTNTPPEDCAVYQPENTESALVAVGSTTGVPLLKVDVVLKVTEPVEIALVTFACPVRSYVNVVVVGVDKTVYVPSNAVVVPEIVTRIPATNPCAADVVKVATPAARALFEIEAAPIAPLFEVASKVTKTPAGVAAVYPESVELPVAFVATD